METFACIQLCKTLERIIRCISTSSIKNIILQRERQRSKIEMGDEQENSGSKIFRTGPPSVLKKQSPKRRYVDTKLRSNALRNLTLE